ncbi:MAG: hypothetical protein K9J30_10765 [Bacteroidales bacterium]|nr:hypothetical protein [Bacteroidales bacterium]
MRYSTIILVAILMHSCNSQKHTGQQSSSEEITFNAAFVLSPRAQQFLQELYLERGNQNNDTFIPSENLANKYSLRKLSGEYHVIGFLHTAPGFDVAVLDELGITTNSGSEDILTVSIPVQRMEGFLETKGIKYFEITRKARTNKN